MRLPVLVPLLLGATAAQAEEPAASSKFELTVYPAAVQVNGKWTQHAGTFGAAWWHPRDDVAFQLSGGVNWMNAPSTFSEELIDKVRAEAQVGKQVLLTWNVLAGVEVTPVTAQLALIGGAPLRLDLGLGSGIGFGGSRHQLLPAVVGPTWGDTGVRPVYAVGASARIRWGEHLAFRLELKDVLYSSFFDRVNGCSADELRPLWLDGAPPIPGPSCNLNAFGTGSDRANTMRIAETVLQSPSAEVLHNVGASLGVSLLF